MKSNKLEQLLNLVQSLTKAEKAQFTKQASLWRGKQSKTYLELYRFLLKQTRYGEAVEVAVARKFSHVKQLGERYHYLYNQLLKMLRNQPKVNPRVEFFEMFENVEILREKALYKEALVEAKRAKKFGYKYEIFEGLLMLFKIENYLHSTIRSSEYVRKLDERLAEADTVLEHVNEIERLNKIYRRLMLFKRRSLNADTDLHNERQQMIRIPEADLNFPTKTFTAGRSHAYILVVINRIEVSAAKKLASYTAHLENYERHPQMKEFVIDYISANLNCALAYFYAEMYDEMQKCLQVAEALRYESPRCETIFVRFSHSFTIKYYGYIAHDSDKLRKYLDDFDKIYTKYQSHINRTDFKVWLFMHATGRAYLKDWSKADELTDLVLTMKLSVRADVDLAARLLKLVCSYEANGQIVDKYLKGTARSLYLHFYKHKFPFNIELNFCSLFSGCEVGRTIPRSKFEEFKQTYDSYEFAKYSETLLTNYFDYQGWFESKLKTPPRPQAAAAPA